MTNPNSGKNETSRSRYIAAGLAGLVFGGAIGGVGVALSSSADKAPKPTSEQAVDTKALAVARAAEFTAALHDKTQYPKGVIMSVVNGEIITTIKIRGDARTGMYKNPILLATPNPSVKPDKDGKFLDGSYIGVQGTDENGLAVIKAQPYNPASETFKPYDAAHILLPPSTAVYATDMKGGPGFMEEGLIGFDSIGKVSLQNGDHSLVEPGLSLGMK